MGAEKAARDAGGPCGPIPGYGGSPAGRRRLIGRHCYQHPAPGEEGDGPQGALEQHEEGPGGAGGQDGDGEQRPL